MVSYQNENPRNVECLRQTNLDCCLLFIDHMHMTSQKGAPVVLGGQTRHATCTIAKHALRGQTPAVPHRRAGPGAHTD